jgi:hypothetical protein
VIDAARGEITHGGGKDRGDTGERPPVESVGPRADDDEDAEKTDARRRPAPPADLLAQNQGGCGGDGQRVELGDGH